MSTENNQVDTQINHNNCYYKLSKIARFQQKICKTCEETGKYDPYNGKKVGTNRNFESNQMSDISKKDFKVGIYIFTEQ